MNHGLDQVTIGTNPTGTGGDSKPSDNPKGRSGSLDPLQGLRRHASTLSGEAEHLIETLVELHVECVRLGTVLRSLGDEQAAQRIEHMLACIPDRVFTIGGYPQVDQGDLDAFDQLGLANFKDYPTVCDRCPS